MFLKASKNIKGFTLVELIVSITIIGLISTLSIANYKKGSSSTELLAVSQDIVSEIRKVQSYALSFREFNNDFPSGGWGIRFQVGSSELITFADVNLDSHYRQSDPNNEFYESKNFSLADNVYVSNITVGVTGYDNAYIVYVPPDPSISIGGSDNPDAIPSPVTQPYAEITLMHKNGASKIIELNKFGLIDLE